MTLIKTAGVLVFSKNKVLLVKNTLNSNHLTDTYGIPAGKIKVEVGELPEETAILKLRDESGLITELHNLIRMPIEYTAKIKTKDGIKSFSLVVFVCTNWKGELKGGIGTSPEWVPLNKVNKLNLLPNVDKIIKDGKCHIHPIKVNR
ncbi:MAG TPA: NUDIX hydrolase [Candidatus Dojkabacteria bacterium]|nr:NUDIX hydrolase [Candidatus Dojkabacteria bacterium]